MASRKRETHPDVQFFVDPQFSRRGLGFDNYSAACEYAVAQAADRRKQVILDITIWSESGARWWMGEDGVDYYLEDEVASVYDRITIQAWSGARYRLRISKESHRSVFFTVTLGDATARLRPEHFSTFAEACRHAIRLSIDRGEDVFINPEAKSRAGVKWWTGEVPGMLTTTRTPRRTPYRTQSSEAREDRYQRMEPIQVRAKELGRVP